MVKESTHFFCANDRKLAKCVSRAAAVAIGDDQHGVLLVKHRWNAFDGVRLIVRYQGLVAHRFLKANPAKRAVMYFA